MKRFYQSAEAQPLAAAGFTVALDGRPLKTPAKAAFSLPTLALAEACAFEWRSQADKVRPETMPLTRLANVAIDRTPAARAEMIAAIAKHGETDLLCHRAEAPAALVAAQAEAWDKWLGWAAREISFAPACVVGVRAAANDVAPLASAADALDDFRLTALAHAVALSGSAILGFALLNGAMAAEAMFEAAALDECFQLKTWGEDREARARLEALRGELDAADRFLRSLA